MAVEAVIYEGLTTAARFINRLLNHALVKSTTSNNAVVYKLPSKHSEPCNLHTYNFGLPDTKKPGAAPFIFKKKCLSDSGCSRSIVSKDVLDRYGIKYEPNTLGERLLAAGGTPLHVNGRVVLEGTFYTDKLGNKKSCFMDCLVSDSLFDEIIIS